jgi:NAD(P)H-dependent flavin oxidoreductase YrpB (nitropropane dioxygenase family)
MSLPALLEGKLRIPVIGAPMFIVSGPELVLAASQRGTRGTQEHQSRDSGRTLCRKPDRSQEQRPARA